MDSLVSFHVSIPNTKEGDKNTHVLKPQIKNINPKVLSSVDSAKQVQISSFNVSILTQKGQNL